MPSKKTRKEQAEVERGLMSNVKILQYQDKYNNWIDVPLVEEEDG